jgi:hypothetical protein
MSCPFLDAPTRGLARDVLRTGLADMAQWHASDPVWIEFIDKLLAAVNVPNPPEPSSP